MPTITADSTYFLQRSCAISPNVSPDRAGFVSCCKPAVAIFLGSRAGIADARASRPPYILGLVRGSGQRLSLVKEAVAQLATLTAVAILLDAISQFLILRAIFPGAALVVGPVLIALPYSLSRALSNRLAVLRSRAVNP